MKLLGKSSNKLGKPSTMKQLDEPSSGRLIVIPPVLIGIAIIIKTTTNTKIKPLYDLDKPSYKEYKIPPYSPWKQNQKKPKLDLDTNIFDEDTIK